MPLYEIEHCIPLSKEQRDELAQTITHIHTKKFSTPSLFVNVRFTDVRDHCMYIAGQQRTSNRIFGVVRAGGPRTAESFDELAQQLEAAWDAVINGGKRGHGDKEMKVVSIQGSITAGVESGLLLPRAGGDAAWLNENKPMFERLAQAGDADFVQLLDEMQNREDLVKALSDDAIRGESREMIGVFPRVCSHGPTRSRESFNELCSEINSAWHHIVHPELSNSELPPRELELAAIFITSELLAGMKVGFPVPAAGTEIAWAKEHFESFKERAALGDEDFVDYVEELEKKPEFNEAPRSE
ncbi:hypothetical protein CDV31_002062 [Fusarium ambrosium]|uniref:Tautomerase cis-CaaD-like domain-containing protein n=1 Tax=Fusarium ambrosium TaxID=131363 RepID=A0A428UXV5_9HYPO|nr:hypothetical protein CDV31_002062 [Fusarium ambrosium]